MKSDEEFTRNFKKYERLLQKTAVEKTGDYQLAEDICQQVFTRYYEKMEMIEEQYIKAWLLLAVHNLIIDYYRKQDIRKNTILADNILEVYEDRRVLSDIVVNRALLDHILAALKQQNVSWYKAIVSVYIKEMSTVEAAKHLGITPQVLRKRLCRARKFIRANYKE